MKGVTGERVGEEVALGEEGVEPGPALAGGHGRTKELDTFALGFEFGFLGPANVFAIGCIVGHALAPGAPPAPP